MLYFYIYIYICEMIPRHDVMLLLNQVTSSTGGVLEDGPGIHQEGDDGTTGAGADIVNNTNGGPNSDASPKQGSDVDGLVEEIPSTTLGSPEIVVVGSGEDSSSSLPPPAPPPKDEATQKVHSETTLSKPPRKRAHVET